MARTGESYQKALTRILALEAPTGQAGSTTEEARGGVDLLAIRYFGVPAAIATIEIAGRLAVLVVSSPHHPAPFPRNPIVALGSSHIVH